MKNPEYYAETTEELNKILSEELISGKRIITTGKTLNGDILVKNCAFKWLSLRDGCTINGDIAIKFPISNEASITLMYCDIKGDLIIDGAKFNHLFLPKSVNNIIIKNSVILNLTGHNYNIKGNVIIENSCLGQIPMDETVIKGDFVMKNSFVQDHPFYMTESEVFGNMIIKNCIFGSYLGLWKIHIKGNLELSNIYIKEHIYLPDSKIDGKVIFSNIQIEGVLDLDDSNILDKTKLPKYLIERTKYVSQAFQENMANMFSFMAKIASKQY